jgi:hypothetical protein
MSMDLRASFLLLILNHRKLLHKKKQKKEKKEKILTYHPLPHLSEEGRREKALRFPSPMYG